MANLDAVGLTMSGFLPTLIWLSGKSIDSDLGMTTTFKHLQSQADGLDF